MLLNFQLNSPLRKTKHIKKDVDLYHKDLDMVVSVKKTKSNPYFVLYEENENGFLKKSKKGSFTRKQDVLKVWELNGAVYVMNVQSLLKKQPAKFERIIKYEMGELESVDLDAELDWKIAEIISNEI